MFERIQRLIVRAKRVEFHDPVLGRLVPSAEADWWEVGVPVDGGRIGFKIGGDTDPSPELIAHASEIVQSFPRFRERITSFLMDEALRQQPFADEIRQLEIDDVCLFWPARPDGGMIYFHRADECRVWRCDYIGRVPVGLGFDS
jgi:hypothetical protein